MNKLTALSGYWARLAWAWWSSPPSSRGHGSLGMRRVSALPLFGLLGGLGACSSSVTFQPAPGTGGTSSSAGGQGSWGGDDGADDGEPSGGRVAAGGVVAGGGAQTSGGSAATGGAVAGGGAGASGGALTGGGSSASGGSGTASGGQADGAGGGTQVEANRCWALDGFYDDFRDPRTTSDCWSVHYSDALVAGTDSRGYSHDNQWGLVFRPKAGPAWQGSNSGFLLYQNVHGNFLLEVQVWVFGGSAPSEEAPVATGARIGLLAAREIPSSSTQAGDYYAIKVGTLEAALSAGFEASVTTNKTLSRADDDLTGWDNSYLRLCRMGNQIWSAYLPSGESAWRPLHQNGSDVGYNATAAEYPDLDETLVVGVLGELADSSAMDGSIRTIVGQAEFSIPADLDDCAARF